MPSAAAGGPLPTLAWQKAAEAPVYALDGGVYCASAAVNWARGLGLFAEYDEINGFGRETAIARGLVFVPALSGLACPHWDRRARGAWLGLGLETSRQDLMQALLEGVALRAAQVVAAIRAHVPEVTAISVDGGMSANPYFVGFLANVLGCPLRVAADPELTAQGTAALAAETAVVEIAPPEPAAEIPCSHPAPDALAAFRRAVALVQNHPGR